MLPAGDEPAGKRSEDRDLFRVRVLEAVVGKPSRPTPTGELFVEESNALNATDVGAPFGLALARSDVLQEFDGGPGRIALHGLAHDLDDLAIRWLVARVGPGVPVTLTR